MVCVNFNNGCCITSGLQICVSVSHHQRKDTGEENLGNVVHPGQVATTQSHYSVSSRVSFSFLCFSICSVSSENMIKNNSVSSFLQSLLDYFLNLKIFEKMINLCHIE